MWEVRGEVSQSVLEIREEVAGQECKQSRSEPADLSLFVCRFVSSLPHNKSKNNSLQSASFLLNVAQSCSLE